MTKISQYFLYIGTPTVALASSSLMTQPMMSPLVPMPIYLVLLAWLTSFGFIVFLPVFYVLCAVVLDKSQNAERLVLIFAGIVFLLDMAYLAIAWNYGMRYQGQYHTTFVSIENVIGFGIVVFLSVLGLRKPSKILQQSTNLLLFILLAWCAFPYLGELP
jgi:hypothetical protein